MIAAGLYSRPKNKSSDKIKYNNDKRYERNIKYKMGVSVIVRAAHL